MPVIMYVIKRVLKTYKVKCSGNFLIMISNSLLVLFFALFLSSCSRKVDSSITVQLPAGNPNGSSVSAKNSSSNAVGWSVTNPSDLSAINCYVIAVGGPEVEMQKHTCRDMNNNDKIKIGLIAGIYPAGNKVSLDVPSGNQRTIHLIGFTGASTSSCQELTATGPNKSELSNPYIIGNAIKDLNGGVAEVTITPQFKVEDKLLDCDWSASGNLPDSVLTGFSPISGELDQLITVNGRGFKKDGADNVTSVFVGDKSCSSFTIQSNTELICTLGSSSFGEHSLIVKLNNQVELLSPVDMSFDVRQPANVAPVIANGTCDDQSKAQDVAFTSCTPTFTDADGDSQTWAKAAGNTCGAWLSVNTGTGEITGTPGDDDVGTCTLTIKSNDGTVDSNILSYTMAVTNVAPTLTIANAADILEDAADAEIRNDAAVAASEEGFGVYSLIAASGTKCSDNGAVTISSTTGAVNYDPANDYSGTCNINVQFDDGNGGVISGEFSITVTASNDAPVIDLGSCLATINVQKNNPITSCTFNHTDPDSGDSHTWEKSAGNTCLSWLLIDSSGNITGTPITTSDSCTLIVNADDGAVDSNTVTLIITVDPMEIAPTADISDNQIFKDSFIFSHGSYSNFYYTVDGSSPTCGSPNTGTVFDKSLVVENVLFNLRLIACDGLGGGANASAELVINGIVKVNPVITHYFENPAPNTSINGGTNHQRWNSYVQSGNNLVSSPTCLLNGTTPCRHAGLVRKVELPGVSSCAGLTLEDDAASGGAFEWTCEDQQLGHVQFTSWSFKEGKGLKDLINLAGASWKSIMVTLNGGNIHTGSLISNPNTNIWTNPIAILPPAGGSLSSFTGEDILLYDGVAVTNNSYNNYSDGLSIVNMSGSPISKIHSNPFGDILSVKRLWFEVDIDSTGKDLGSMNGEITFNNTSYSRVHNTSLFNGVGKGLRLLGNSSYNLFTSLKVSTYTGPYGHGILIGDTNSSITIEGNKFIDVNTSNNDQYGLMLDGQADNSSIVKKNIFNNISINNNKNIGLYLQGVSDNIFTNITSVHNGNTGDSGIRVAGGVVNTAGNPSDGNIFTDILVSKNGGHGLQLKNNTNNTTVIRLLSYSNLNEGIRVGGTSAANNNKFYDISSLDNGSSNFTIDLGSSNNKIYDKFSTNNPNSCVGPGTGGNTLTGSVCAVESGDSNFAVSVAVHPFTGTGEGLTIDNWINGLSFLNIFNLGGNSILKKQCVSGISCPLFDWSFNTSSDFAYKGSYSNTNLNDGNLISHTFTSGSAIYLFKHTQELNHEGNTTFDGICERGSGETCLFTPNISSYQGEGTLTSPTLIPSSTSKFVEFSVNGH